MKENSFYLIDNTYIKLINNLGGKYGDSITCCYFYMASVPPWDTCTKKAFCQIRQKAYIIFLV